MTPRSLLLFLSFLITCSLVNSQQEAAIWYFGENAGLDFRSGTPVTLLDGALNTREGCATISDSNGNLLFYTDGITVWNRNHQPMPNGTGLLGNSSSTQSAIIVPNPGNPDLFYIFTADELKQEHGINYNVVDISLEGGLGDIIQKNVQLLTPAAEKLTAVRHANGTDIWVLTHDAFGDAYLAYRVTPAGVDTTPVISNLGINLTTYFFESNHHSIGYLKASPDGKKVAAAHNGLNVDVMDFDSATGILTNAQSLLDFSEGYKLFYGLEFSPSSRFLYTSSSLTTDLYQYDLEAADIRGSVVQLNTSSLIFGALQLGIDGKIYMADMERATLSMIENPNELGVLSTLNYSAIDLGGRTIILGLPPFITSYFQVDIMVAGLCEGSPTMFESAISASPITTAWDFGDGNTSNLENPSHTYAAAGDYTVSVTVTTASEVRTETKDITIFETPVANAPTDLIGCTSYGSYNVDLPSFNTTVLGAQDPTVFIVDYFLSQADADNNTNPLEAIHAFDYGTTPVFARVSNTNNGQCYDTAQFNIIAREAPLVDTIADWTVCDDDTDGLYTFDLSFKNPEIFNGQDETKFEILYFSSQAAADAGTNPLSTMYTNTLATEELFIRFQNTTYPDCYRTASFMIEVSSGVVANTVGNLEICDDDNDGFSSFNLATVAPEIIGTQNSSTLSLSYHETMADAENSTNPLPSSYTNTVTGNQTIYVRVENVSDTNCYATTSFELLVYDTPQLQTLTDWVVCDDNNDGSSSFNLTEKNSEILGEQDATQFMVRYFETRTDAELAQNEITGPFTNASNPQTIFYRLENASNTSCYVADSFDIQIFDTPFALEPSPIILCDNNETGSQNIDLTQKNAEILGTQDANDFNITYFASRSDAENGSNPLNAQGYTNLQMQETLFAKVIRIGLETCSAITSFELNINPLPQPLLEERYVICPDSPVLILDGGVFDSWSWKNNSGLEVANTKELNVEELGIYELTVTQVLNGVSCENSVSFEILSSGAPETLTVETNGFSDQIEVLVSATGTGSFEYSLDGENFQSNNKFIVFPGTYTVYVRDILECRTLSEEITAIGYQKFFSPNGDSIHDNWNIIGAELFPDAQLFIYDRYGKLLKQLSPQSVGWDGTYFGQRMPASDYWFRFAYGEGEVFSGHFTLKR